MARRKKRVTIRKRKSTVRDRVRKPSESVRAKAVKRTATKLTHKKGLAKAKRPGVKKVARKKATPMKLPTPVVETTIIDVVEEPVPGVITVTEFEETDIREAGGGQEPAEED
jgi:hypothetical protein